MFATINLLSFRSSSRARGERKKDQTIYEGTHCGAPIRPHMAMAEHDSHVPASDVITH